jgi:hypothetical protein
MNETKLVIMDFPYLGFLPQAFGQNGPWWFSFHQIRDMPEALIQGNEREYISWFMKGLAYNPAAITEQDIDVWTNHIVAPSGLRGSFEHFRAFPVDEIDTFTLSLSVPAISINSRNSFLVASVDQTNLICFIYKD